MLARVQELGGQVDPQGRGRSWGEAQKGASSGEGFGYLSFGQKAEMPSPKMACQVTRRGIFKE